MSNRNELCLKKRARYAAKLFCESTQHVVRASGASGNIVDQVGWDDLAADEKQKLADTFEHLLPRLAAPEVTFPGGLGEP